MSVTIFYELRFHLLLDPLVHFLLDIFSISLKWERGLPEMFLLMERFWHERPVLVTPIHLNHEGRVY